MTKTYDWVIRGGTVVSGSHSGQLDVAVLDGAVAEVSPEIDPGLGREVFDATSKIVFPGIIDSHNHPYYDDDIEQFSLSAAHGGITTLVAFAGRQIRLPQTGVVSMVEEFIADGRRRSYLDFGLHVILTPTDDFAEVLPALFRLGVTSYKAFLAFPKERRMMPDDRILDLMQRLASYGGLCMVHCENGLAVEHLEQQARRAGRITPHDYVDSRPPALESEAAYRALAIAEVAGCDCYIVHVSAAETVDVIRRYKGRPGPRRYSETCPHYLLLTREDQERIGGPAKISPPMRDRSDQEALWAYLLAGDVDVVSSDCSGRTMASKREGEPNIFDVVSGLPGVEHLLPLVYDEGVNRRAVPLSTLARVLCENPADIFGLNRKGRLRAGYDADLTVFDPDLAWALRGAEQHGNSDFSIYEGRRLLGRAHFTMQRGRPVLRSGEVVSSRGAGSYIPRGQNYDTNAIANASTKSRTP